MTYREAHHTESPPMLHRKGARSPIEVLQSKTGVSTLEGAQRCSAESECGVNFVRRIERALFRAVGSQG